MDLAPDFDEFIGCLTAHGVDFVIVGAYVATASSSRMALSRVGRDTLIRNKRAAGRPKDLADIDALSAGTNE